MKYYCDYCDTYLTHDSPSVRKTHCNGRKHKDNVRIYYQKWMEDQAQTLIDRTTAAFQAGKIQSNPFTGQQKGPVPAGGPGTAPGGTRVPPPQNYSSQSGPPGFQPQPGMGGPDGARPPIPGPRPPLRPGMMPPGQGPMMMRPGGPPGPMMRPMGPRGPIMPMNRGMAPNSGGPGMPPGMSQMRPMVPPMGNAPRRS